MGPFDGLTETQRQQIREAHAANKEREMRKPGKPWRVSWADGNSADYRSQRATYEAVRSLTGCGLEATVHHWEDGSWRLYETVVPVGLPR